MLAYKMEDEWPATYTELLKTVRQIKKRSQPRHPSSQHSQSDGSSNVQATAPSSLFPLTQTERKLPSDFGQSCSWQRQ